MGVTDGISFSSRSSALRAVFNGVRCWLNFGAGDPALHPHCRVAQARSAIATGTRAQVLLADSVDKCFVDIKLRTKYGVDFGGRVSLCQNHTFVYLGQM